MENNFDVRVKELLQEEKEKERPALNIIITGLPEPNKDSADSLKEDEEEVLKLLKNILPDTEDIEKDMVDTFRLGHKGDTGKPRSIKVVMKRDSLLKEKNLKQRKLDLSFQTKGSTLIELNWNSNNIGYL